MGSPHVHKDTLVEKHGLCGMAAICLIPAPMWGLQEMVFGCVHVPVLGLLWGCMNHQFNWQFRSPNIMVQLSELSETL